MAFKRKTFQPRESILTQLFEDSLHFRSLCSIVFCFIAVLIPCAITYIILHPDVLDIEVQFLKWGFIDSFPQFVLVMSLMGVLSIPQYYLSHRLKIHNRRIDALLFFLLLPLIHFLIILTGWILPFILDVKPPLRVIILTCQVPLLMKLCSVYIVSYLHWRRIRNCPSVKSSRSSSIFDGNLNKDAGKLADYNANSTISVISITDLIANQKFVSHVLESSTESLDKSIHDVSTCKHCSQESLGHFFYFLFTPTLIYRLSYPKTDKVDWWRLTRLILAFLGVMLSATFMIRLLLLPIFRDVGLKPYNLRNIPRDFILIYITGSTVFFVFIGIGALHLVNNIIAEILQFSDRLFYRDWWSASNIFTFFTRWNCFVQDWIFEYLYQSAQRVSAGGKVHVQVHENGYIKDRRNSPLVKFLSTICVFFGSAFVHDYFLGSVFGFYVPFFMFKYFIAVTIFWAVYQISSRHGIKVKGFISSTLAHYIFFSIPTAILVALYPLEYYSRINCPTPVYGDGQNFLDVGFYVDLVYPRFLSCASFTFE